ncbi:MAG: hypothetical protein M3N95_11615 [Actinomycetota bacterium]|nr:hypothetical protein [Actinomycetota bacterium]
MASIAPRLPENLRGTVVSQIADFHVDELAADMAGPMSPFGPDAGFPLPVEQLRYRHPGPESRPNLADGR